MGAIAGFFFGVSLSLLLVTFGHVALNSSVLAILPPAFLVVGVLWGLWAPLRRRPPSAFAPPPAPATEVATPTPAPATAVTDEPSVDDATRPADVSDESADEGGGGADTV